LIKLEADRLEVGPMAEADLVGGKGKVCV
jgi:hypothetical protein